MTLEVLKKVLSKEESHDFTAHVLVTKDEIDEANNVLNENENDFMKGYREIGIRARKLVTEQVPNKMNLIECYREDCKDGSMILKLEFKFA